MGNIPSVMKIVCSTNMPFVREAFETLGDVVIKDGRAIGPDDVRDAEILAIRSTTDVNREMLAGSRVRFVGTATIGYDHIDVPFLEANGIHWCASPGCNANSVSEYVTAALLTLATRHGIQLEGKTIGVIGVGNIGSRVVNKALALGMNVLPNDPPRARREEQESGVRGQESEGLCAGSSCHASTAGCPEGQLAARRPLPGEVAVLPRACSQTRGQGFVSLDQLLPKSDIVTLHVPLSHEGSDKTVQMANEAFFAKLKPGAIFINSARGGAMNTDALLAAMDTRIVSHAVIDTWEGEPTIRRDLLDRVDIGTSHIAGHSFEGKVMGTLMVYREACKVLGITPTWTPDALLPPPLVPEIAIDAAGRSPEAVLHDVVRRVYDIEADDCALRRDPKAFDALRKNYPIRREFHFTHVDVANDSAGLTDRLAALGFDT